MLRGSGIAIQPLAPLRGSSHKIMCLPSVLQTAVDQFHPYLPVLGRAADVYGVDYIGPSFADETLYPEVASWAVETLDAGDEVTLVGIRFGGMQIPYITKEMVGMRLELEHFEPRLHAIVINAPSGPLTWPPAWPVMMRRAHPRDWPLLASQLRWVAVRGGRELPLEYLNDVDVSYIAHFGEEKDFDAVRQPAAANVWRPYMAHVEEAKTANIESFVEVVDRLLNLAD